MDSKTKIKCFEIFDRCFAKLANMPQTETPEIGDSLDEICEFLRIGMIKLEAYVRFADIETGQVKSAILYENGPIDNDFKIVKEYQNSGYALVIYTVCLKEGEEPWNEFETERIELMLQYIYIVNSRIMLMNKADRMTNYDVDLEIHNYNYFIGQCRKIIEQNKINNYITLFFNLRRFSSVNQLIGRNNATRAMKRFVQYLDTTMEEDEVVARVGGDNFVAMVKKVHGKRLLKALEGTPVIYDDANRARVNISASVGIYVVPDDAIIKSPFEIMDKISTAVQIAKNNLDSFVVFYDEMLMKQRKKELEIEAFFPEAYKKEEFLVYYQPKVSLTDNTLSGAEALCRWRHDDRLISPGDFIPIMERSTEICKLDFYMFEHVCRDIRKWLDEGKRVVTVSVNFSRRHLTDQDFLSQIIDIVDKYKVPHEYIEVELTETTTDVQFRDLKRVVKGLQTVGISTAVDDFGVGYSSLNLIRDIPWNVLKIDKSFLPAENEKRNSEKEMMFGTVVQMAHNLGLKCIVEGVETKEQVGLLKAKNCMMAQGFYFNRPLPKEEFEKRMDDYFYPAEMTE